MTNDKPITLRCWIKGSDEPITDESQLSQTDFVSCPKALMDEDTFQDRLDKSAFKYEAIYPSKSGKAWNAYRVGYAKDYGADAPIVGLTI